MAVLRRSSRYSTLRELADLLGVHKNHLQAIESGRLEATTETLKAIAKAVGAPLHVVEAAHLEARKSRLRGQAEEIDVRLREIRRRAS